MYLKNGPILILFCVVIFPLESVLKVKILSDLSVGEWGSDSVLEKRLKKTPDKALSCTHVEFLYGKCAQLLPS